MISKLIIELVKCVANETYKTIIIEVIPNNYQISGPLRNKNTDVTGSCYNVNGNLYLMLETLKFGDEYILPESSEHADSLMGETKSSIFCGNHIIISKDDNLSVKYLTELCYEMCCNLKSNNITVYAIRNDDTKEVKHGCIYFSNCS